MNADEIVQSLNESFYTKAEFNELLYKYVEQRGLDGISYTVEKRNNRIDTPFCYTYGCKLEGESPKTRREITVVESSIKISYSIWSRRNVSSAIENEVLTIINSYLDIPYLYKSSLLPSYEQQRGSEWLTSKLDATVKRFLNKNTSVAFFMIDLDHFKAVNDTVGHENGSSVIFEFSNLLVSFWEEKAVVIHRSGDEFFILMPYTDIIEPLALAYKVREAAKSHSYQNAPETILTAAQGICLITTRETSFYSAVDFAEEAYKRNKSDKYRDSIRIVSPFARTPERETSDRDLAFVVVRSHLLDRCIFHNPYLDFISFMSSQCDSAEYMQAEVEKWFSWIRPDNASGMQLLSLTADMSFTCSWSNEEFAFALFHGMCRNSICQGKNVCLEFGPGQDASFIISLDSEIIYSHGEKFALTEGQGYTVKLPDCSLEECAIRNVVSIHIGYDPLIIPDCFDQVIRIDARPIIGGNLPDFWAGALSELIDHVTEKAFINQVIVYGDRMKANKMCNILRHIDNWGSTEYSWAFLSKQTQQPNMSIEECRTRLKNRISFVDEGNKAALIQELKRIYSEGRVEKRPFSADKPDSHRFLDRKLPYEPLRLKIEDGCIVNTMEEAFPTVLEIIRNYETEEIITDQAGRELKELTNFKLTITKPSSTSIPEYYWEQQEDLDKYYQSVLGNNNGFFQKHLEKDEQYKAVLQHVVNLIDNTGLKYATRRAVLVIPHKISDQRNISPLGLVSVYISPRETKDGIIFNFSFTWRTVEAVLGLPYSLYGSVRYAERLLEEIKKESGCAQTIRFQMGHVSYIAYSLHMFLDSPYTRIVRGIING